MQSLLAFLRDCGNIKPEDQAQIFSAIKEMRTEIINRPYAIQQSFFNVSHHLHGEYTDIYKQLLSQLSSLSKQRRKHTVQNFFPELDIKLGIIQGMKIKIDENKGEKTLYAKEIKEMIQKIIDVDSEAAGGCM